MGPSLVSRIHLETAARVLHQGGLIAYPTEAVYGLGCLPWERLAVERLLDIKRRSWRKGLSLIAASRLSNSNRWWNFRRVRWPRNCA